MTHDEIAAALDELQGSDIEKGAQAVKALLYESFKSDAVYRFYPELRLMLSSVNPTTRTRVILILAHNARWDEDKLLDEFIEEYLTHLYDEGNETAEHCIRSLVWIAKAKPYLKERFINELSEYDIERISLGSRAVIEANIADSLNELAKI